MVSEKQGKRYTPRFKFQVVMEILAGTKAVGQIVRSYGVHPVTLTYWKKEFIEKGPEIFSRQTTIQEYEKQVEELERLIGHKEVEIALLKYFLDGSSPRGEKVELTQAFKDEYGLNRVLAALGLSKGTWSYALRKRSKYPRGKPRGIKSAA